MKDDSREAAAQIESLIRAVATKASLEDMQAVLVSMQAATSSMPNAPQEPLQDPMEGAAQKRDIGRPLPTTPGPDAEQSGSQDAPESSQVSNAKCLVLASA